MGYLTTDLLDKIKDPVLFRTLTEVLPQGQGRIKVADRIYTDISSNDYLGLSYHPRVVEAAAKALEKGLGASASRLMTGSTCLHHELERKMADFKGKPSVTVMNSGYQANLGVISAICGKNDCVFFDRLSHASIIDGVKLSGAASFRFRHNDMEHLETLIKKNRRKFKTALIVTETVFSMDGDFAPLKDMVRIKEKYSCLLMVDEAHATGIFGEKGSGMAEKENVTENTDIIMGTFSKALGSFGAYLATNKRIKAFLVNRCRSFIYSTALPPPLAASCIASIEIIKEEPERREALLKNSKHLRDSLTRSGVPTRGMSQIIPVILGKSEKAVDVSLMLKKRGWWAIPMRPPTVPEGEARIRVSVSYHHGADVLERLASDIQSVVM